MTGPRFRARVWLAVLAIALMAASLVAAALLAVNWTERAHPLDWFTAVLAVAALVSGVLAKRPAATSDTPVVAGAKSAAQVLAGLVEQQWRDEARHRLVDDDHPMPVRWQLTANKALMGPRHLIAPEGFVLDGSSNEIAALICQFRTLKRPRLVITGGPGMGKTTLAVQMLLHLLAIRAADLDAAGDDEVVPVPVLLPVSGWNTENHPRLQDWLTDRLERDYPALKAPELGPDAAGKLVHEGHILPILDGLDEVDTKQRVRVLTAVNASLGKRGQLILTSRRDEFEEVIERTGRPVFRAAVIVPTALTPLQAAGYLRDCLSDPPPPAWAKVLDALSDGAAPGLAAEAATPLGLWLIRTVYLDPGADPSPLSGPLGGDATALRSHLLNEVIPALIATRPPSAGRVDHFRPRRRWDPDAARRYLSFLAGAFPPAVTRDLPWWRIATALPGLQRVIQGVVGLAVGLGVGLTTAITISMTVSREMGIGFGLSGLGLGLYAWSQSAKWPDDIPSHANLRLRGRIVSLLRIVGRRTIYGVGSGLSAGFGVFLVTMTPVGSRATPGAVVVAGTAVGIAVMLGAGLVRWAEYPTLTSISTPTSSWRSDRTLTLLRTLGVGGMSGVAIGFAVGIMFGPLAGLAAGVAIVLASGLTIGDNHAWLACRIAAGRLCLSGLLPWRIMPFLDDAHRLGLLRAVGPIYQFRHASLHDHLAATPPPDTD
ncbi:NACHT domain-containing protein [Nonomuraea sp. NPDC046802]|uniref:NACHT domain-containing protein n=1 Tax=Nonomuraea sp. NPDC046802 TaxID=3154919 RepID=UPI00340003A7